MGLEMLNAAAAGDCGELERLIDGGFDIDATYASTRTGGMAMQATAPLAVMSAKDAAARFLLDRGASTDLVACSTGHTPLMDAAAVGSLPIMQLLLEAKAKFDAADPTMRWTAFNTACADALVHAACAEALAHARCGTSLQAANAGMLAAVPADIGPPDAGPPDRSAARLELVAEGSPRAFGADTHGERYNQLFRFLSSIGLNKHASTLIENEVDFETLLVFTEADLAGLGIAKGPRVKMLRKMHDWHKGSDSGSSQPSRKVLQLEALASAPEDEFFNLPEPVHASPAHAWPITQASPLPRVAGSGRPRVPMAAHPHPWRWPLALDQRPHRRRGNVHRARPARSRGAEGEPV